MRIGSEGWRKRRRTVRESAASFDPSRPMRAAVRDASGDELGVRPCTQLSRFGTTRRVGAKGEVGLSNDVASRGSRAVEAARARPTPSMRRADDDDDGRRAMHATARWMPLRPRHPKGRSHSATNGSCRAPGAEPPKKKSQTPPVFFLKIVQSRATPPPFPFPFPFPHLDAVRLTFGFRTRGSPPCRRSCVSVQNSAIRGAGRVPPTAVRSQSAPSVCERRHTTQRT